MKRKTKERTVKAESASVPPPSRPIVPPVDAISRRAREIWQARGQPAGCDEEIWYEAERQIAAEMRQGMPPLEERGITVGDDGDLKARVDEMLAHRAPPRASPTSLPP